MRWRADLYRGTSQDYERWRPPYPGPLFEHLRDRVAGRGRLLDMACGTGQVTFPLAPDFGEVVAVDQEPEALAVAREKADRLAVANITWVRGAAEKVGVDGPFDLVTIGNAFHRLDRAVVAERAWGWLSPGGALALLWTDYWRGEQPWQQEMERVVADWMAELRAEERLPPGWASLEPTAGLLEAAGFAWAGRWEFRVPLTWSVESLVGFTHSTSTLSREVLGDRAAEFERDLGARLLALVPDGRFEHTASFAYELAFRP